MNSQNNLLPKKDSQSVDPLDAQIDAALNALGNAMPTESMQARLLQHARHVPFKPASLFRLPARSFATVACSLAIVTAIAITRHKAIIHREEAAHNFPLHLAITPPAIPQQPMQTQKADPHNIPNASPQQKLSLLATSGDRSMQTESRKASSVEDSAYAEMNAPSKPAPELPLTEQEKRLLAVGKRPQTGDQLAELRRPGWPQHDSADADDFRSFFQKPPAPEQPGDKE